VEWITTKKDLTGAISVKSRKGIQKTSSYYNGPRDYKG
jgi:hypothetical protein